MKPTVRNLQGLANLEGFCNIEKPWRDARKGLDDRKGGGREITLAAMAEFYEGACNEGVEIEP